MNEDTRTNRESEVRANEADREEEKREEPWTPPSLLPTPKPQDGYVFRWIRTRMLGVEDNMNVSKAFREGWEPVKAEDHPELMGMNDFRSQFSENFEQGGLLLCKMSEEKMKQKREYLSRKADSQMEAVDNSFMRENNPRMPLLKPERSTKVTFGGGER